MDELCNHVLPCKVFGMVEQGSDRNLFAKTFCDIPQTLGFAREFHLNRAIVTSHLSSIFAFLCLCPINLQPYNASQQCRNGQLSLKKMDALQSAALKPFLLQVF